MTKLLVFAKLLPALLDQAIDVASKSDEPALADLLKTEGKDLLEQMLVVAGEQEVQNDKEDRAHFVAHLAAQMAQGRAVQLSEVRALVTVANAIAAEALVQCGVIQAPEPIPSSELGLPPELDPFAQVPGQPVAPRVPIGSSWRDRGRS